MSLTDARRLGQVEHHDSLAARNARLAIGETISVRLRRFDAEAGDATFQDFQVPYRKWMRLLDALNWIAENAASDLAYRWFCGSKMCGTCAAALAFSGSITALTIGMPAGHTSSHL